MRKLLVTAAVALAVFASTVASAPEASAADAFPCGPPWFHPSSPEPVQTCPDWSPNNWIPVYASPSSGTVVGHIYAPGNDWYVCQWRFAAWVHTLFGYQNDWWAYTLADNGGWGWVPETYFRGGANFEPDAGLRHCNM